MDKLIPAMYRTYGQYVNAFRSFPLIDDGCKPVERRVLLSSYEVARDKFVKCARIDGMTIARYHPHGTCITGDTRIILLDGTEKTIKELTKEEKPFWVFSCKPDGTIVPGRAHSARITKKVKTLCRVTFDNGQYLDCTDDHLIMLRDGNYQAASFLKEGISVMPLYLLNDGGYLHYRKNN